MDWTGGAMAPRMQNFFEKRDPWGHGLALWVMGALVFLAPLAVSSLRGIRLDNEVESWLPEEDPQAKVYQWCREHFPEKEQVVLSWEGSTIDDLRLPILLSNLQGLVGPDGVRRGGLPYVDSAVHAGQILEKMTRHGVDVEEAQARLEGVLLGRGRLKVRLTEAGREVKEKILNRIRERSVEEVGIALEIYEPVRPWGPPPALEDAFDAQYEAALAEAEPSEIEIPIPEHDFQVGWTGMSGANAPVDRVIEWIRNQKGFATAEEPTGRVLVDDCFIAAGSPIAVLVALSEAGIAAKAEALEAIREAAGKSFIPVDQVVMGGRAVASAALNGGVLKAAWNTSASFVQFHERSVILLSGLVGIAFAFISLRSIRLGMLVVGTAYYAALLGLALVPLTGGEMNMVLIVMPTLLMVLALSGAIHIANYWRHAVWEHRETAVIRATELARTPCLMAAVTTSIGLISLAGSDLQPVRSFGIYAALGSLISVAMVLYGLPALLQMSPLRRVQPDEVNSERWHGIGRWICRHSTAITCCCLVFAVCGGLGLQRFATETKVIRYFRPDSRVVHDYQEIEETLTGISPIEIVVSFSPDAQENYRFLERLEIVRKIEESVRQHPEISGTLSLAGFQPVREAPAVDARVTEKVMFNRRSNEAERRVKDESASESHAFVTMQHPPENTLGATATDELWRIQAQAAVLSDADYSDLTANLDECVRSIAKFHPGTSHVVTGTVPLFLRTQQAVLESLIVSFGAAFGLIALVMVCVLKDPLAGMFSMVPNLLPVITVFGLLSWAGIRIDVGMMVTASVALGIAVDGTLHLITWFIESLKQGRTRSEAVILGLAHCGPAMWQTSAAVGVGLLVLFPADLLLISRFGWLMATLIGAALIGDVVMLPAMLAGPLGFLIERRLRKSGELTDPDTAREGLKVPKPHIALIPSTPNPARRRTRPA